MMDESALLRGGLKGPPEEAIARLKSGEAEYRSAPKEKRVLRRCGHTTLSRWHVADTS